MTEMTSSIPANLEWMGFNIRTFLRDGRPWVVASDAAAALGVRDAERLVRTLPSAMKGTHKVGTLGGKQNVVVISRDGLLMATMRAHPRDARRRALVEAFQLWACRALDDLLAGQPVVMPARTPGLLARVEALERAVVGPGTSSAWNHLGTAVADQVRAALDEALPPELRAALGAAGGWLQEIAQARAVKASTTALLQAAGVPGDTVDRQVLAALQRKGPMGAQALCTAVHHRKARVLESVRRLAEAGMVVAACGMWTKCSPPASSVSDATRELLATLEASDTTRQTRAAAIAARDAEDERRILEAIRADPYASNNRIRQHVSGNRDRVCAAIKRLGAAGVIQRGRLGWAVVSGADVTH